MYHPLDEHAIIGIVGRVDHLKGRFMVDGEWFQIKDIESAQLDY
ncbi:hypothetical protein [Paenibacillus sp. LPE1-1-1.1]